MKYQFLKTTENKQYFEVVSVNEELQVSPVCRCSLKEDNGKTIVEIWSSFGFARVSVEVNTKPSDITPEAIAHIHNQVVSTIK